MAERRRATRQKSFLRGCVYFNKRRGAVDCLIREISDEGARIIFSDTVNVPDVVELYIPQKEQTCGRAYSGATAMRSASGSPISRLPLLRRNSAIWRSAWQNSNPRLQRCAANSNT